MPDVHSAAELAPPADPPRPADGARPPGRGVRLLGLVGKLIDYGRNVAAALQRRNTPDAPPAIAWIFGATSLALIIARVTRAIRIAEVLQVRLTRGARRLDAHEPLPPLPRPSAARARATRPAAPRPPRWPGDDADALRNLPSAREIARLLRNRSIGDVIVDICNDLCIGTSHPLWREIMEAVRNENGNVVRLVFKPLRRTAASGLPAPDWPDDQPIPHDWAWQALFGPAPAAVLHPP
jgi:hypothetical protein